MLISVRSQTRIERTQTKLQPETNMSKYILIVTEKPDAALRIATALDKNENPKKISENGVPYYIVERQKKIVVVPSVGHLYTIDSEERGRNYPVFTYKWVPRYTVERKTTGLRKWIDTITKLAGNAESFVDACDYDIEGSIIGYCILKYACRNKDKEAKRMKYSTLTKQELEKSYSELLPHLDFRMIEAGCARHEVDWLYGINLSRALTNAAKNTSGRYKTISTGRVQGPTLNFVVAREEAIRTFVPIPYWQIKTEIEINNQILEANFVEGKISTKNEAELIVNSCKDKNGRVEEVKIARSQEAPPFPFDLGTLQNEAYGIFTYTPRRVLRIAQQLYLKALISYPRTNSQKLPPTVDYEMILKKLSMKEQFKTTASELLAKTILKPNEGKKNDPAHPAIYPTGNLPEPNISTSEKRLWDLIARRFMSVFGEPALKQNVEISISVEGHILQIDGMRILKKGWIRQYSPYAIFKEKELPSLEKCQVVKIKKIVAEPSFTRPPWRYNENSLLKEMEKAAIGTKATRADIIQTLYDRGYVKGKGMMATGTGLEVSTILEKHCPSVVSAALTRELEAKMNGIQEHTEEKNEVLDKAIAVLKPVLKKLKKDEKDIGEHLSGAIAAEKLEERVLGSCPVCKTGKLLVTHSRRTGKRFIGCTNYFKGLCSTSFPLPQSGTLELHNRKCPNCGWTTVQLRMKRHRWTLCFNPDCPPRKGIQRA
jgi:DNA topoisomerase I